MPTTTRLQRWGLATVAAVLLLTGALNVRSVFGNGDEPVWEADPAAPSATDALVGVSGRGRTALDAQIAALQDALRADEGNGRAAALLGRAYLQKARETGDPSYYPKADALFGIALDRDDDDVEAMVGAGTLALARHDFAAALRWGEQARAITPYHAPALSVIADAQIELGRYDEAIATVQAMVDLRPDLPSFSRVSYVRELMGDVPGAIAAMEQAATAGAARAENLAWTQVQIGNLLFGAGDLDGAERRYAQSLATLPGYVYGLAGLARVEAARGDYAAAIDGYREAIRTMPIPEFVIALGDVYLAAGQRADAERQYALVEAMQALYAANGVDTDAELALFDADHGRNAERAVERARAAYAQRPSVRVADALAWTLYAAGDPAAAKPYSDEALRLGTRDALLFFHAGMIAAALGQTDAAIAHLERAFAINPHFSLLHADAARTTLERLKGGA